MFSCSARSVFELVSSAKTAFSDVSPSSPRVSTRRTNGSSTGIPGFGPRAPGVRAHGYTRRARGEHDPAGETDADDDGKRYDNNNNNNKNNVYDQSLSASNTRGRYLRARYILTRCYTAESKL